MHNTTYKSTDERVVFAEDIKSLASVADLSSKKLCIIKTDFKNLNPLKYIIKQNPNTEFWLASKEISRKNIMKANGYGIKNVIQYPFDLKIIRDFFHKKNSVLSADKYSCEVNGWMKGLKVMIVDDNPMNVELLAETLAASGLNISTFLKPADALAAIENEQFDLFLLDVMMPEISGFDLASEIQSNSLNKNSPVIFISALSDAETKITGYDLGTYAYIEKPFDVNVVRSQVFNILKTKRLQEVMNQTKDTFIALTAHDLKSPVNAEITALELLLKEDFEQNEMLTDLLQAAKYMKNLIDNILNKYKFENSNAVLYKTYYSLNSLITESISEMKYLADDKKQHIIYNNYSGNNAIFIDYIEIKRVVNNILSNAIEYARKNSDIEITLSENKNYLEVSIESIANSPLPDNINEIFEKFVSFAVRTKCVNSGLGLYVSKKIIEAHNGTIRAEILPDNKMRFTFVLPKSKE